MENYKTLQQIEALCMDGIRSQSVPYLKSIWKQIITLYAVPNEYSPQLGLEYDQYYTRAEAANRLPLSFEQWLYAKEKESA